MDREGSLTCKEDAFAALDVILEQIESGQSLQFPMVTAERVPASHESGSGATVPV
jgi:hypothetical protein